MAANFTAFPKPAKIIRNAIDLLAVQRYRAYLSNPTVFAESFQKFLSQARYASETSQMR
jgi:hypothetical protein